MKEASLYRPRVKERELWELETGTGARGLRRDEGSLFQRRDEA